MSGPLNSGWGPEPYPVLLLLLCLSIQGTEGSTEGFVEAPMMETPQASMNLVCQPTILCSGGTEAALEYSPAQPAPFPMDGYHCGSTHASTNRMEEASRFLIPLGAGLHLLPVDGVQLIVPSHSSPQQHFDGRAQDSCEFPYPQYIHHLGPLSLFNSSQYLLLPLGIYCLLFP